MSRRRSPVGDLMDEIEPKKRSNFKTYSIGFKTKKQQTYYQAILTNTIVISTGVAGSGKSFIAVYAACCELAAGNVDKIIITKPAVEIGRTQGFLPGDMEEKMAPFTRSVEDCFFAIIGKAAYNTLYSQGKIEILPINFMRGLTFERVMVIADEMQNADYGQVKALLTRIGEGSKFVLNGDLEQSDLNGRSGLPAAIEILKDVDKVEHIEFEVNDIVRSGILKEIIIGYHFYEKNNKEVNE
jgi:phosphate starvation-inducible PhoH-like protein